MPQVLTVVDIVAPGRLAMEGPVLGQRHKHVSEAEVTSRVGEQTGREFRQGFLEGNARTSVRVSWGAMQELQSGFPGGNAKTSVRVSWGAMQELQSKDENTIDNIQT